MKVSGFTFIKNGVILGYPFLESILSVLPIVDEFIVNVGDSEDDTLEQLKNIKNKKVKIIQSSWNDTMRDKGYVYGQQKMIAQFNCTGDWLFYVEGDEVYHEDDLANIRASMEEFQNNPKVEALAVSFYHFYGNQNTYLDSPGWYRSEARILKNNIRTYAPDGLFWLVLKSNKVGRYPNAKEINAHCYHYGWIRNEQQMQLKSDKVHKYWNTSKPALIDYSQIDSKILKEFTGAHPKIMLQRFGKDKSVFKADPNYRISKKERKHRVMNFFEKKFNLNLSKRHYKKI